MKTDRFVRDAAQFASRGKLTDFLFMGVAVVPIALVAGGEPGAAMLLFIPLLFAGCFFGMWEQVESPPDADANDAAAMPAGPSKPPATAGASLRRRL